MTTIITPAPDDPSNDAMTRFIAVNWIDQEHRSTSQTLAQCLRRAASRPWPDLTGRYYSFGTLESWYYTYKHKGLEGLRHQQRKDKGISRSIDQALGQWITQELRHEPSTIPLTTLYEHWLSKESMPLAEGQSPPHIAAIRRYLKAQGITRQRPAEARCGARKTFEAAQVNDLWMVDFSPGPFMLYHNNLQPLKTHLCVIIDDHSRLVTHAAYYPKETTASFHDCLKNAIRRRGLPHKLYTDNGGAFISHHSKQICARIDIQLLHHKPYAAWSKGKVEKMIGSIQQGFETWIRSRQRAALTLIEVNRELQEWLENTYHQRRHRKTQETPLERYLKALKSKDIRLLDIDNDLQLERLFYLKSKRKVRADGTIQLGGHYYEVSLSLKGFEVEIHHNPLTNDRLEIWHENTDYGCATPVDYLFNARRRAPGSNPPQHD